MKKAFLIFIAFAGAFQVKAQNINPENDNARRRDRPSEDGPATARAAGKKAYIVDKLLPNWCIDVNGLAGLMTQDISGNLANNYKNAVNTNIGDLNFNNGTSFGFDAQVGYFFNASRHFGVGTGIMYLAQQGNMTVDNFHVEYQSTDKFGSTFRQLITANGQIKESINTSSFNIPILFKYKTRCSEGVGFTVDAGLVINVHEKNSYSSNASFDYEAIYDYSGAGGAAVYDNSTTPLASDLLLTKTQYQTAHPTGNVQDYFRTLKGYGYNVGLGVKPGNNSGDVSYTTGSLGFLVRPAVSFYLSDNIVLNLGLYYLYQDFDNGPSNTMLTNKVGDYGSVISNITKSANNSYGVSLGLRFFLGSPTVVVAEPEAPTPVEEDEPIAVQPAPAKEEPVAVAEVIDVSTPILFNFNKTTIHPVSYPILEEAVKETSEDKNLNLIIHGYADKTGTAAYNLVLSKKRANAVKTYLRNKGVNPKRMKTVAHGFKQPAETNKTPDGRTLNRRVVIRPEEKK
jgi:outer membrane protein OmpA-like peptidoglycan-associated protein